MSTALFKGIVSSVFEHGSANAESQKSGTTRQEPTPSDEELPGPEAPLILEARIRELGIFAARERIKPAAIIRSNQSRRST
jgi:hypothetical protein